MKKEAREKFKAITETQRINNLLLSDYETSLNDNYFCKKIHDLTAVRDKAQKEIDELVSFREKAPKEIKRIKAKLRKLEVEKEGLKGIDQKIAKLLKLRKQLMELRKKNA